MGEHTESNGTQGGQQTDQVEQQQPPEARASALVHFNPSTATEAWQLARYYGQSKLIPAALRQTGDVFVTIMAGRDFGWSPMQALRGIHVVEGRPSLAADAMVAIVKASGRCKYFRLVKSDDKEAIYETHREGDPEPVRMGFTIEEAKLAGLTERKGPWQTYRKRMLRNRAKSILCKEVYEDIFFGVFEEDEGREVETIRQLEGPQKAAPAIPEDRTQPPPVTAKTTTVDVTPEAQRYTVEQASAEIQTIAARAIPNTDALTAARKDLRLVLDKIVKDMPPATQDALRPTYQTAVGLLDLAEKKIHGVKP